MTTTAQVHVDVYRMKYINPSPTTINVRVMHCLSMQTVCRFAPDLALAFVCNTMIESQRCSLRPGPRRKAQHGGNAMGRREAAEPPPQGYKPLLELSHPFRHGVVAAGRELVGVHAEHSVEVAKHNVGEVSVAHCERARGLVTSPQRVRGCRCWASVAGKMVR